MITAVEQRKLRDAQQTERELAEKVQLATLEQMKHTFQKDMETLRGRVPNQTQIAKDAALDKKYLADRQKSFNFALQANFYHFWQFPGGSFLHSTNAKFHTNGPLSMFVVCSIVCGLNHLPRKGQDFTKEFMESKCKLVFPKTAESAGMIFADAASFISKLSSQEGVSRVYLVQFIRLFSHLKGVIGGCCLFFRFL